MILPQTLGSVLIIVGAIWIVQGLGILDTGSFMDRQPFWAVLGAGLAVAGLVLLLVRRRRTGGGPPSQPDS